MKKFLIAWGILIGILAFLAGLVATFGWIYDTYGFFTVSVAVCLLFTGVMAFLYACDDGEDEGAW